MKRSQLGGKAWPEKHKGFPECAHQQQPWSAEANRTGSIAPAGGIPGPSASHPARMTEQMSQVKQGLRAAAETYEVVTDSPTSVAECDYIRLLQLAHERVRGEGHDCGQGLAWPGPDLLIAPRQCTSIVAI